MPTVGIDGKFNAKNTEVKGTYSIPEDWIMSSGWNSRDTGCKKWTDTNYETDRDTMVTLEDSGVEGMFTTGENYWLASHLVGLASTSSSWAFFVRRVDASGSLSRNDLCSVYSDGGAYVILRKNGLRPCISLNPNIKVIGGDGKEAGTAYELGI